MLLRQINDPKLAQYAYLIGCQRTGEALLIDPERDIDRYLDLAAAEGLRITAVAETHIHADFLSGARELAERTGAKLFLSDEGGTDWRYVWPREGDYAVQWLTDGDTFSIGRIEVQALHTPGHTPEHLSFLVTDHGGGASEPIGIASGDFVFVGDLGRPDLLETAAGVDGQREPSARALFRSLDRFLALPDFVQVWPGHGAGSACGKALGAVPSSTVGYEKRNNASLDGARRGEEAFVASILEGQPEPPVYFATMKRLNKMGPPLLGRDRPSLLPTPSWLSATELLDVVGQKSRVVVDTRRDPKAFMAQHLAGSLHAPLDRSFPTIVGSYLRPGDEVVLIVDQGDLDEAVRDLVRIGFEGVVGFASPTVLDDPALSNSLRSTPTADFDGLAHRNGGTVLDVRGAAEFAAGHVPGALNIAHTRLASRLEEVPRDEPLWVHCRSGARAATATAFLERQGFQPVWVDDALTQASVDLTDQTEGVKR